MDRKLLFYNFAPVIAAHLVLLPFWYLQSPFFTYNLSLIESLINILLVPIYLVVFNYRYALKNENPNFWPQIVLMWVAALAANVFAYLNWGLASGELLAPQMGTFFIFEWVVILNFATILLLGLIVQYALRQRQRSLV